MLRRSGLLPGVVAQDIEDFLDYFLSVSVECPIYFLWRPQLPDPKDDLLLELALAGDAVFTITFNGRDFRGVDKFGIRAVTPGEFLRSLGAS